MKKRRSYNKQFNNLPPSPVFQIVKGDLPANLRTPTREELICCLMGKVGFSGKNISRETGLNLREVYRVLERAKIKLWDFRHGKSQWGKMVTNACVDRVTEKLQS